MFDALPEGIPKVHGPLTSWITSPYWVLNQLDNQLDKNLRNKKLAIMNFGNRCISIHWKTVSYACLLLGRSNLHHGHHD